MSGVQSANARVVHRRRSLEARALGTGCRVAVKSAVRAWALTSNVAWPLGSIDRIVGLVPERTTASVQPVKLPNCRAEVVRARGASARTAILYLHGGAFLTCGLNTHRKMVARLSAAADALVLNVDYRMLPVSGLSDAVDDAMDGLEWLWRSGYDPSRVVIAGDSAGGYLAFAAMLESMSRGVVPAGLAAISPLLDLDPARKLAHRNIGRCSMFTGAALSAFARYVRRSQRNAATAVIDPMTADLSGMPPVTIHVSADESLYVDSELVADRLEAAETPCELHVWRGQIHDFPLAADILPEGRRALEHVGRFVKDVTSGATKSGLPFATPGYLVAGAS